MNRRKAPGGLVDDAVKEEQVFAAFRFTQALHRRNVVAASGELVQVRSPQPMCTNTQGLAHMFALKE
ncbi:hypothetical protein GCM10023086_44320 [Streptomyces venetus]|uniref:Uncharacterized protein n=1 Tax=Streptomyces venetus TaxID=1701086 RepID=A0ABP8G9P3_9ACTN